jgi:hypothetical protein
MTSIGDPDAIPDFAAFGPYTNPPGVSPSQACMVFAHLLAETFDGFLVQALYAVAARRCFDHARLFVYHGKVDERLAAVPSMLPDITFTWRANDRSSIPLDYFDSSNDAALRAGSERWYEQSCDKPDVMLLPSMMDWRHLGAFERPPRLELPRDRISKINKAVRERGLAMNWWFCAVAVPDRDSVFDREGFNAALGAATETVSGRHGAALVLVGDPSTQLAELPAGVLDLRDLSEGVFAQSYVISKARFLLELAPTAWLWIAFGMDVPWLRRAESTEPSKLPGRGCLVAASLGDFARLNAALRAMIAETRECPLWRPTATIDQRPAPNRLELPMRPGPDARFLSF